MHKHRVKLKPMGMPTAASNFAFEYYIVIIRASKITSTKSFVLPLYNASQQAHENSLAFIGKM